MEFPMIFKYAGRIFYWKWRKRLFPIHAKADMEIDFRKTVQLLRYNQGELVLQLNFLSKFNFLLMAEKKKDRTEQDSNLRGETPSDF